MKDEVMARPTLQTKLTNLVRVVAFELETTGLSIQHGARIVEVGGLEIVSEKITGRSFHSYCNPESLMDEATIRRLGRLTAERIAAAPTFSEIADGLIRFVGDATLVIHNAPFALHFLDAELERFGRPSMIGPGSTVDTLRMAKQKGLEHCSLPGICKYYGIAFERPADVRQTIQAVAQAYLAMKQDSSRTT